MRAPAAPRTREQPPASAELVALARASLSRGHHRVALQRVLKLRALDQPVPNELVDGLRAAWDRIGLIERQRMRSAAEQWAHMVQPMYAPHRADAPPQP